MSDCSICGENIPDGSRTCPVCGSSADEFLPMATGLHDPPVASFAEELPMAPVLDELPMAPILDDEPPPVFYAEGPPEESAPAVKVRCQKPEPGTPCLVLYGPDKEPLQYFALTKDAMLIGRLDAVAGNFPDIDLDQWFDRATIRKISRQHALILRTRASSTFVLRPLVGNTGTQLEANMVAPAQDYPLRPGHRIILGGVIRLKFEIA